MVGVRLRRLGLSQVAAGRLIGAGHNAFSRYERGEAAPLLAVVNLFRRLDQGSKTHQTQCDAEYLAAIAVFCNEKEAASVGGLFQPPAGRATLIGPPLGPRPLDPVPSAS
jgi:hypothetical protein